MDALEAPDSSSQCAGDKVKEEDLPTTSSKALKTQQDLPDAMSECAETQTGHTKPKDEVVDTRHVVDVLPMFEVGSTGQAWTSKHLTRAVGMQVMKSRRAETYRSRAPRFSSLLLRLQSSTYCTQGEAASDERCSVSNLTASRHQDARNEPTK
ncbi:hypothetical protein EV401DRAFT_1949369, partial [Pisolithus croceorrhizus]